MIEDQDKPKTAQNSGSPKWLWWAIGGGCLLLLCCTVIGIAALTLMGPSVSKTFSSVSTETSFTPEVSPPDPNVHPETNSNSMGDPNAPVKIMEFSDFQCPFCQRHWQETEPQIIDTYVKTGKIQYTYRSAGNWVSKNIGQGGVESQNAAMAAYCAGDQGKFWEYHATLFSNVQGEDAGSFTDANLQKFAQSLGLDTKQFSDCYTSKKYADKVAQDYKDALAAGIKGTPSFVLSYTDAQGKTITILIEGAQPFDAFKQEIDKALAAAGTK